MGKRQIFYSFHYEKDLFRVQQIRNIGAIEENKPISHNKWETIKKGGDKAIRKWIDDNMKYRSCLVVLVGEETYKRPWVNYEIRKAWNERKGVLGIYIDDLIDPRYVNHEPLYGRSYKGDNPFDYIDLLDGKKLSTYVKCYTPPASNTYRYIAKNLENWIEYAIRTKR